MSKHFKILVVACVASVLLFGHCKTGNQVKEEEFLGYWHGALPANPSVDVVLYFFKEGNNVQGKAFFTEGKNINSIEVIQNVVLSGNEIDFDIPSQGTHYSGKISPPDMKGGFDTPGNPFLNFTFAKTDLETLASFAAIRDANKPYDLNHTFTLDQLKEDFSVLKRTLLSHPRIYLYTNKDQMGEYFNAAENKLYDGMTAMDFMRVIAPLIANVKCYHTQLIIPEKVRSAFLTDTKSIPIDVVYIDDRAFVIKSLVDDPKIQPGSEILEINGRSSKEVLQILAQNVSSDGYNMSHKIAQINKNFWMLYHLIEGPDNYSLKIKHALNGNISDDTVSAIESEKVFKDLSASQPTAEEAEADAVPITLSISGNMGILTVTSFMYTDLDRYKKTLATYFNEINDKQVKYLIVNLRGNTGGYPVLAADLFSYFIQKSTPFLIEPSNDPHYSELLKSVQTNGNSYKDRVYFLSDGNSLSSTGLFLALIKYHKLGMIAGDIPGGSFSCSDDSKRWELPNSKIQFTVPRTTFTAAVEGYKKGDQIKPDFLVKPTVTDLITHKDVTMAYVLSLISKKMM